MTLAERLAGLLLSPLPVWVLDPQAIRIVWANEAALRLWKAADHAELYAREFRNAPKGVLSRFDALVARSRVEGSFWDEWTFYPKGQPVRAKLWFNAVTLDDGGLGLLQHAVFEPEGVDPAALRGSEALLHTSVLVALVSFEGAILMKNPAAINAFGADASVWPRWFVEPDRAEAMLRAAAAGEASEVEIAVHTLSGERWHRVSVRPIRDAVTGVMTALVHQTDETTRKGAEEDAEEQRRLREQLDRTLSLVEEQRAEILSLSAPLMEVEADALALPIIGHLDAKRSAEITGRLLSAIADRQIRHVIIDLTGTATLDAVSAELLVQMIRAVELLGAAPIVTGIRPSLAQVMVASGFDLERVLVLRSLADGIRRSRRRFSG